MKTKKQNDYLEMIKSQEEEVLSLMRSDWQLGESRITGRPWLQKGGLGSGGISKNVNFRVIEVMLEKGKIFIERDDPKLPKLYALK